MFWTFSKKGKKQQVIKTSLCKSLKKHCRHMCKRTLNRYEFSYALLSILRGGSFHHLLYDTFWTRHTMLMIYCELKSSKVDIRLYNYTHTHTHTQNEIASARTLAQTWYSELSNQSGIKWSTCGYNWSDGGRNSSEIKQKNQIANAFYAISRSIHRLIKACCQFARAVSSMTASVTTSLKYRVSNIFEALPGHESPASRGVLGSLSWDRKPRKSRKNVPYLSERNFKFREPHKMEKSFPDQIKVLEGSLLEGTFCQGRPFLNF
jgi:hypothetical protein